MRVTMASKGEAITNCHLSEFPAIFFRPPWRLRDVRQPGSHKVTAPATQGPSTRQALRAWCQIGILLTLTNIKTWHFPRQ